MTTVHDILRHALRLPEPERALVARELVLSLDANGQNDAADRAELQRRLDAIENGEYSADDWRCVMARLHASLAETSAS
jgi:putative addiction module component (TIGR02574 family)